mgnify:CR=1 FL=1
MAIGGQTFPPLASAAVGVLIPVRPPFTGREPAVNPAASDDLIDIA